MQSDRERKFHVTGTTVARHESIILDQIRLWVGDDVPDTAGSLVGHRIATNRIVCHSVCLAHFASPDARRLLLRETDRRTHCVISVSVGSIGAASLKGRCQHWTSGCCSRSTDI